MQEKIPFISKEEIDNALKKLNLSMEQAKAEKYADYILEAADSKDACDNCTKEGSALLNCSRMVIQEQFGAVYLNSSICSKKRAYIEQRKIDKILAASNIGKLFQQRSFSVFEVTDGNRKAYELCKSFAENYKPHAKGIMLSGDYGTGKTHLSASILAELAKKHVAGAFVVVPELFAAIRNSFSNNGNSAELLKAVTNVEVLVLDDLGAERTTDWLKEQLFILVNHRYEHCLPTIVTSNYMLDELENYVGRRITSRFWEMMIGAEIKGADYRMRQVI